MVLSRCHPQGCSDAVVRAICDCCQQLEELYVSGNHISKEQMEAFRRVQPKCEVYGKLRRVPTAI